MPVETANADDVRAGLRRARGARLNPVGKTGVFSGGRWEDGDRGVGFQLRRAVGPRLKTPNALAGKRLMEGAIQFDGRASVNVCVTAQDEELFSAGPWTKPSDPGVLEGHVYRVCIEQINNPGIERPSVEGLSERDCQEIAFLIEAPLRDVLEEYGGYQDRVKYPDGPLREGMLKRWTGAGQKIGAMLARGEISRSHPFAVQARQSAYRLGEGADELSVHREVESRWHDPHRELVDFHEASARAVRCFDPRQAAKLPFDHYAELSRNLNGTTLGVLEEPDTRIILIRGDPREGSYISRTAIEFGRQRIELDIHDIGFGSLSAHGNQTPTDVPSETDSINVHVIVDPRSPLFGQQHRILDGVTDAMIERAMMHIHTIALSPEFGLRRSQRSHLQLFRS